MTEEVIFHMFLKKMTPNYLEKKVLSYYEEEEVPVELVSKVKEYYLYFCYQAIKIVVNCVLNNFQQKDHIETVFKSVA